MKERGTGEGDKGREKKRGREQGTEERTEEGTESGLFGATRQSTTVSAGSRGWDWAFATTAGAQGATEAGCAAVEPSVPDVPSGVVPCVLCSNRSPVGVYIHAAWLMDKTRNGGQAGWAARAAASPQHS